MDSGDRLFDEVVYTIKIKRGAAQIIKNYVDTRSCLNIEDKDILNFIYKVIIELTNYAEDCAKNDDDYNHKIDNYIQHLLKITKPRLMVLENGI